MFDCDFSAA